MVARLSIFFALCLSMPAWAEPIDGSWCSPEGRQLVIRGETVTTPGGAHVTGSYNGQAFSYAVPKDEPGGGGTVYVALVDEDRVEVRDGTPMALPTVWRRCARPI